MTSRSAGAPSRLARPSALALAAAIVLLLAGPPARAQEPGAPAMKLDLDQAIDLALDGAFGLRVARNDLASSQSGLRAAENAFDFRLTASFQDGHAYQRNGEYLDPANQLVVKDYVDEDQRFTFELEKQLRIGGSVELRTDFTRRRTRDGSPDPLHDSTTSVGWTIPLWGGRGRKVATSALVNAETGLRQGARSLIAQEMELVVDVVRSFYQVLRRSSVLEIDRAAVERAEENYRTYQLRLEEGLVTPIDVARAERELRGRQNAVVADEESLQAARDQLLQVLALPLEADLDVSGEPVFARAEVDLALATDEALANRADLRSQRESVELAELARHVARSGTKPKLDLTLSAAFNAVEGDDAGKWFDIDDDDRWIGGVGLSYTFGDRTDDEALTRAIIDEDSTRIRLEELQRRIVLSVRDAVRNVRSLERQIELLEDNVRLAEESLRLAQLQLEEDLIRTTDLLQIQDELVRAQTDRVNALYDHAIARVSLDLELGRYRVGEERRRSEFLRGDPPPIDVPVLPRVRLSGEPAASAPEAAR